jgi:type IV pilus assembly protein PilB
MEAKKRLGELLLESGVIDETQLQAALGHQRRWGMKLGQALLDLKLATEPQVVAALARKFGYESADLAVLQAGPLLEGALKLVPRDVAAKHTLLPLAADTNSITVAMADPTNIAVVDELSFRTGRRVRICIAGERELAAAIRRLYFGDEGRRGPEPIALSLDDADVPIETTTADDPFSVMPEHLRDRYQPSPPGPPLAPPPPTLDYRAPMPPPPVLRPTTQPAMPAMPQAGARPTTQPSMPAMQQAAPAVYRPAPPPPVAAPPLAQPAAFRAPPPAPLPPEEAAVDISELAPAPESSPLNPREAALADAIQRLTRDAPGGAAVRVATALARLLVRKGVFTEVELLDELQRK